MAGHLFIARGDLLHLHCDAILIPSGVAPGTTDRYGHLVDPWKTMVHDLGVTLEDDCLTRPPGETDRIVEVVAARAGQPAVWAAHSGSDGKDGKWYAEPYRSFIRRFARRKTSPLARPLGSRKLLLGVPFLGVGRGGIADAKGRALRAAVDTLLDELDRSDVDVVFTLIENA